MTNLTTKLNKLMLDDSPSEKLINACAEIDIESCFDPIFEPPIDFLEECRKRWENRMNPFTGTVERKSEIPGICWRLYVMEMSRLPTR